MPYIIKLKIIEGRNLFIDSNTNTDAVTTTTTTNQQNTIAVINNSTSSVASFIEVKLNDTVNKTQTKRGVQPQYQEDFKYEFIQDGLGGMLMEMKLYECTTVTSTTGEFRGFILLDLLQILSSSSSNSNSVIGGGGGGGGAAGKYFGEFCGYLVWYDSLTTDILRGELLVQLRVEYFSEDIPLVRLYNSLSTPSVNGINSNTSLIEALVEVDDPEYNWKDSFRSPKLSNYQRQLLLYQISSELQQILSIECLAKGCDSVYGIEQSYDFDKKQGMITGRLRGTCFNSSSAAAAVGTSGNSNSAADFIPLLSTSSHHSVSHYGGLIAAKSVKLVQEQQQLQMQLQKQTANIVSTAAGVGAGVGVGDDDANTTTTNNPAPIAAAVAAAAAAANTSDSVLEQWLDELRDELRQHCRVLNCNCVLGYTETVSIDDDLMLLCVQGTAVKIAASLSSASKENSGNGCDCVLHVPYATSNASSSYSFNNNAPFPMQFNSKCRKCSHFKTQNTESSSHSVPEVLIVSTEFPSNDAIANGMTVLSSQSSGLESSLVQAYCYKTRKYLLRSSNNYYGGHHFHYHHHHHHNASLMSGSGGVGGVGGASAVNAGTNNTTASSSGANYHTSSNTANNNSSNQEYSTAQQLSDMLPFIDYELYRQLLFQMRLKGYNALFGYRVEYKIVAAAENIDSSGSGKDCLVLAYAYGTGCCLYELPLPRRIFSSSNANTFRTGFGGKNRMEPLAQKCSDRIDRLESLAREQDIKYKEMAKMKSSKEEQEAAISNEESGVDSEMNNNSNFRMAANTTSIVVHIDDDYDTTNNNNNNDEDFDEDLMAVYVDDDDYQNDSEEAKQDFNRFQLCTTEYLPQHHHSRKDSKYGDDFLQIQLGTYDGNHAQFCTETVVLVKQAELNPNVRHPNRELALVFKELYEELKGHLLYSSKNSSGHYLRCLVHSIRVRIEMQKEDLITITLTAAVLGQFKEEPADGKDGQDKGLSASGTILHNPSPIVITPNSYLPCSSATDIVDNLGRISLHFIKEDLSMHHQLGSHFVEYSEDDDYGRFINMFKTTIDAVLKAHVTAMGGNALVSFKLEDFSLRESVKNQAYGIISVSGDVVRTSKKNLLISSGDQMAEYLFEKQEQEALMNEQKENNGNAAVVVVV